MKKMLLAGFAVLVPLSAFACDGSVSCAMRQAPRQVVEMLPGFFSTHAGLLVGVVIGALAIGVAFRREAEPVRKE